MTGKPILFSGPMVRAIIREIEHPGTGKTQTRRIIKPGRGLWESDGGELKPIPTYQPGMLLWVNGQALLDGSSWACGSGG